MRPLSTNGALYYLKYLLIDDSVNTSPRVICTCRICHTGWGCGDLLPLGTFSFGARSKGGLIDFACRGNISGSGRRILCTGCVRWSAAVPVHESASSRPSSVFPWVPTHWPSFPSCQHPSLLPPRGTQAANSSVSYGSTHPSHIAWGSPWQVCLCFEFER